MSRSVMNPARFRFSLRFGRIACIACAVACMILLWGSTDAGWAAPPLQADDGLPPAMIQVTGTVVNLRAEPGLSHAVRGQARQGTNLVVQGRSADDAWLAVTAPEGSAATLWIYADLTDVGASRYVLPWMGPPAVCTRSLDVRAALLTALAAHDRIRTCETVTWADLAILTRMPSVSDDDLLRLRKPHDLAGLTGLHTAQVVVTDAYATAGGRLSGLSSLEHLVLLDDCCAGVPWPDHFLAGAVRLHDLAVQIQHVPVLPTEFLARVPHLQTLRLYLPSFTMLPATFLARVPHLTQLEIRAYALTALPANFLSDAPRLQALTLDTPALETWPSDVLLRIVHVPNLTLRMEAELLPLGFLSDVPRLEQLALSASALTTLPTDFLAETPILQNLSLDLPHLETLPPGFLAGTPRLEQLALSASALTTLPTDFVAETPLQNLNLDLPHLETLPPGFLAETPRLEQLALSASALTTLPTDFLAETPILQNLSLDLPHLETLPPGFLADVPRLEQLALSASMLTTLPTDFLAETPVLQDLSLDLERLAAVPDEFLTEAPSLARFQMKSLHLEALPSAFLARASRLQDLSLDLDRFAVPSGFLADLLPRLHTLSLYLPAARALPPDFLAAAPALQDLSLHLPWAQALPPGFLAAAPALQNLNLNMQNLKALPPGFLTRAPRLEHLGLSSSALTDLPADFLAEAPRLVDEQWRLPALTRIGPRVLANTARLEWFHLHAPNLEFIDAGFLARTPRLSAFTLNMVPTIFVPSPLSASPGGLLYTGPPLYQLHHRPTLFISPGFLADARNLQTVRMETETWSDIELRPTADFLANLPRLHTVQLDTWLRDPPPLGFLRGTRVRDLSLRVRTADAPLAMLTACLQLILPRLAHPPDHGGLDLDFDLVPLPRSEGTTQTDVNAPFFSMEWQIDAAAYFQQGHLPWAAAHACSSSLLLIDRELFSLSPYFLSGQGPVQRVRLAFNPLRCPACQPDP